MGQVQGASLATTVSPQSPQYQAGIYYSDDAAKAVVERIAGVERARTPGFAVEIKPLKNFFPAEEYHQDYLDKNPGGYCGLGGTGVSCAIGTGA